MEKKLGADFGREGMKHGLDGIGLHWIRLDWIGEMVVVVVVVIMVEGT